MPKRDYFDDPTAPKANSLVVAVGAVVRNDDGDMLLIQRSDNGLWALPSGAQDIGETTRQAAIREVKEETGYDVEIIGISGIYSDPRHVIAYNGGEVRQEFSIVFRARVVGGESRSSSESRRVAWVSPGKIPTLKIDHSMRFRFHHALQDRLDPYLS